MVIMFTLDRGPLPAADRAAARIANGIVFLLGRVLRPGEDEQAVRAIYILAREEIEGMSTQGDMPPAASP
jgi:hypothetical protein